MLKRLYMILASWPPITAPDFLFFLKTIGPSWRGCVANISTLFWLCVTISQQKQTQRTENRRAVFRKDKYNKNK